MLLSMGHGDKVVWAGAGAAAAAGPRDPDTVSLAAAVPAPGVAAAAVAAASTPESVEVFGYFFPDADEIAGDDKAAALTQLAKMMTETAGDPVSGDSSIPPIVTYMGQFIDHDITANTNSEAVTAALRIGGTEIRRQNRSLVVTGLKNLRKGTLGLDSLYGDGPVPGPMTDRLQAALREPGEPRKMRVGKVTPVGPGGPTQRPPLPVDNDADVPRVLSIVGSAQFPDSASLPEVLQPNGVDHNWERKAFIGDSRNDENLILAQLHTAFLRFHNVVVDTLGAGATFEEARQLVRWHYQWLVLNDYLPSICEAATLAEVIADKAPLYARFLAAHPSAGPDSLPMPVEFSAAAFRFGHSMVRAEYDFNLNFSPASFKLLFDFTGNAKQFPVGGAPNPIGDHPTLPHNWIIEWQRFIGGTASPTGKARKIDTQITPPLFSMANEPGINGRFQKLAERNLMRGHVLNLPSAQAFIAKLIEVGLPPSRVLTPEEIASGPTGQAITDGGFKTATPLWFYVLKEAELIGVDASGTPGERLGPVGTRIVAETLAGLLFNDPASHVNRPGGPWTPADGIRPGGALIDSLPALLRAAGVLA